MNFKRNKDTLYKALLLGTLFGVATALVSGLISYFALELFTQAYISFIIAVTLITVMSIWTISLYLRNIFIVSSSINQSGTEISAVASKELGSGVIIYSDDNVITFISSWLIENGFNTFLGRDKSTLEIDYAKTWPQDLEHGNESYHCTVNIAQRAVFVRQSTESKTLLTYIKSKQIAFISTKVSYSMKLKRNMANFFEAESKVNQIFEKFAQDHTGIFRQAPDRESSNLLIVEWTKVSEYFEESNRFFAHIIRELGSLKDEVVVSIGVSTGNNSLNVLSDDANESLQVATNRGGNQVVLKQIEKGLTYLGSSNQGVQLSSKEKITSFAQTMINSIKNAQTVFITTHIYADLDALASAVAIAELVKKNLGKPYIIIENVDNTTREMLDSPYAESIHKYIITEEEALSLFNSKSLLILTDVNDFTRSQAPHLYQHLHIKNKYIIDHHRVSSSIEEAHLLNTHIDIHASSAAEIATEILMHDTGDSISALDSNIATIITAGIYLDTNTLKKATSPRTFDALSFLSSNGAATKFVEDILKMSSEDASILEHAYKEFEKIGRNSIFVSLPKNVEVPAESISIIANKLLDIRKIQSVIVVGKVKDQNSYKMSVRSLEGFNSQLFAETLNGGGHYDSAAMQWSSHSNTYSQLINKIKRELHVYKGLTIPTNLKEVTRKTPAKKTTKKVVAKKPTAKKRTKKVVAKKPTAKKTTKKVVAKKPTAKKTTKKVVAKKLVKKTNVSKKK